MGNGQGSAGNVIAAICSFFIPGLGQLIQGRILSAIFWFLFACVAFGITWLITLSLLPFGWLLSASFLALVLRFTNPSPDKLRRVAWQ